jgi:ATP-binding cassette subfamily B protein
MVWPMTALGMGFSNFQKGYASFERIKKVLLTESDIYDVGTTVISKFETLEFKNVSFKYKNCEVYALKDISFKLHAGESLGIMGPVGSGKTTLVNLLTRLYPLEEGQILVNDIPIENITLDCLRSLFLLIPQETFLFSESLKDNVTFGLSEPAHLDTILRMADVVDLTDEINALPLKFDSQLGERGVNLSGGQKQRLTIARGLIMQTPVLILDDSLSAVDTRTEKAIENELAKTTATFSRIIVAHRLSSLKTVDHLLILKDGFKEAWGTYEEVLQSSPTFQKIIHFQGQVTHNEQ